MTRSPVPNAAVAAGGNHTCAIRGDGGIWCWGGNDHGQLGNGTTTDSLTPVQVNAPSIWSTNNLMASRISAGTAHTCVTMSDRTIWCWGLNDHGQLGNGTTTDSLAPVQVQGFGVTAKAGDLSAGDYFTCATFVVATFPADLHIKCWGDNSHGQLGSGTCQGQSATPLTVADSGGTALQFVASISAGANHVCAIVANADAYTQCWGDDTYGQLGDSRTASCQPNPVKALALNNGQATDVACGAAHTCSIDVIGDGWCIGDNSRGQLGDGTTVPRTGAPVLATRALRRRMIEQFAKRKTLLL